MENNILVLGIAGGTGSGTNYSLNPDCIIFSARIAEQRVETVEFSLEQMKVVQCHGLQNKDTEHHADIINLVNSNTSTTKTPPCSNASASSPTSSCW